MIRRAVRRATPAALLALVAVIGASAQDLPRAGDPWATASTTDLVVVGQAPLRRVEEITRDLALSRSAVLAVTGARAHTAPYPTTVLLLRDDKTFQSYARGESEAPLTGEQSGPRNPIGVLTALDRQGRVLALSLESAETHLPDARTLLAADVLDQLLVAPPPWIASGLPGLIGRLEATGRSGDPPRLIERTNLGRTAEIDLVRHLANPRAERSSQLTRYLTLLRGGAPSGPAFEESFFASLETVAAEVSQVAGRGGAAAIELSPPPVKIAPARELPYDRVVLALGELLLRAVPWNTVAAELHLRAVLEQSPKNPAALRGIALVRELDDRHTDAAPFWDQSLAAAPGDRTTLMLLGWSRLDHFRRSVGAKRGWEDPLPDEVAAARDAFTRAMAPPEAAPPPPAASAPPPAHDPHAGHGAHRHEVIPPMGDDASPHALHGFGATYLFARSGFEPGLVALDRAASRLPGDDAIAADRIVLNGHAANQNLAWEMRRDRLLDRVAPELDDEVEKLLVEEALHTANQLLLVEQQPESAIALVRAAVQEVRDPARRRSIEDVLRQMEQVAAKLGDTELQERFIEDFHQAKELASERRFDDARKLMQPYAAEGIEPAIRDAARDVLRQLDSVDP